MRTRFFPRLNFSADQRGISLVETLVGMTVGLVASLVIMKSFSSSESFRRSVSGTADTVQTAAITSSRLNMLFEEAGASFVQGRNVWGCKLLVTRNSSAVLPAASFPDPFASFPKTVRVLPVGILDGGTESDVIMVMAGSSPSANRDIPFDPSPDGNAASLSVSNPNGIGMANGGVAIDDLLLSVPQDVGGAPGDCQIVQVASNFSGGVAVLNASLGLKVVPAESAVVAPATYTSIALNVTTSSYGKLAALKASSPSAFHLGREAASTFSLVSVNANGELLEYDMLKRRGMQPFAENVVLIKARYGVDSGVGGKANDNVIDEWVSPAEAGWTLTDLMDGKSSTEQKIDQIKAIRIGLVLRSGQAVSSDAKLTQIVLFSDLPDTKKFTRDLTSSEQVYGYQVFDWVIPLRNMKSTPK